MPGREGVERALARVEERRHPGLLPEGVHPRAAAGEELVRVRLVAHVEDQVVVGRVEDAMERDDELHCPQRRAEVPAHPAADGDDLLAQLGTEARELVLGQRAHVPRRQDAPEQGHVLRSTL